jgi:hypothetical protein
MSVSGTAAKSKAAEIRESAERREHRIPRAMTHEEIEAMPRLRFTRGVESAIFISREREGSRYYSQGLCFHDADMDDFTWDEVSWDEAFYCMKGQLKVVVEDHEGNQAEYVVDEGGHFWAPAGYKYTLKATGVDSINFWTMAPVLFSGWRDTGDAQGPLYSKMLIEGRLNGKNGAKKAAPKGKR